MLWVRVKQVEGRVPSSEDEQTAHLDDTGASQNDLLGDRR